MEPEDTDVLLTRLREAGREVTARPPSHDVPAGGGDAPTASGMPAEVLIAKSQPVFNRARRR